MSDKLYTPASGENFLVRRTGKNSCKVHKQGEKEGKEISFSLEKFPVDEKTTRVCFSTSSTQRKSFWLFSSKGKRILAWPGGSIELDAQEYTENTGSTGGALKPLKLTMPGKVLSVKVKEGDIVKLGDGLLVVEAMKMENLLLASARAKIAKIHVNEGDRLESGAVLISFEAAE